MFRVITVCLLAASATVGCADTHRVTSGGYYCIVGTLSACPQYEASGDCQPCPRASLSAAPSDSHTL
jgi:hypothetical protein